MQADGRQMCEALRGRRGEDRLYERSLGVSKNVFFFKQKTAYEIVSRDWSSDVCSSDLV